MIEQATFPVLSVARQTREMIGQEMPLSRIKAAIYSPGRSFQTIYIRARGGTGKTRLLEEVLRRSGHPDWPHVGGPQELWETERRENSPIVSDLIDVIDVRLHDRYRFITQLRESLRAHAPSSEFRQSIPAENKVRMLVAGGVLLTKIDAAQEEVDKAFINDLREIAKKRRVVFLIDTTERLSYKAIEQLLDRELLDPGDLKMRTHQWLYQLISEGKLENVTLILAGRDEEKEGRPFFTRMDRAYQEAKDHGHDRERISIELPPLTIEETRQYFQCLADDWRAYAEQPGATTGPNRPSPRALARAYSLVADPNSDAHKVLRLYTAGIPVRLALYGHLLAEGKEVPSLLRKSYQEALAHVGLDEQRALAGEKTDELDAAQWEVEEEFINVLFSKLDDRRSKVLLALVRAPRVLTAEQLHFVLDSPEDQAPEEWRPDDSKGRRKNKLQELVELLHSIENDYLGKRRSSWTDLEQVLEEPVPHASTYRIGLQDELYRIYAEHMGLFAVPLSEETKRIRASRTPIERQRYEKNCADERAARQALYKKLSAFAHYQYQRYLDRKRDYLDEDEATLENEFKLDNHRTYYLPDLTTVMARERSALNSVITIFEIEHMVYELLREPEKNLNTAYITLEDDNDKAARQEEDFWAQAEMWRALDDDWLMKFVPFSRHKRAEDRQETPIDVLRRVAEQENASRWIKRFALRGPYQRALDFYDAIEHYIENMPRNAADPLERQQQQNTWSSWNHTLAREERSIWRQVAANRLGSDAPHAIEMITQSLERLYELYDRHVLEETRADILPDGYVHREYGFKGVDGVPAHAGYPRLRRLLSIAHNSVGFAYRTIGRNRDAVSHYVQALRVIHDEYGRMKAHRAQVLNNQARALSELGWESMAVCLDGLNLRRELAEEVPLAGSYNTLALIYDDMGRYEDAPLLAAKAIAYCRRADERRQLGLALRQMAESLRHVAERIRTGQRVAGTPEKLFSTAEILLREAADIFQELDEAERRVEVALEFGSLYRDRMQPDFGELPHYLDEYRRDALDYLNTAGTLAQAHHMEQHVMDVRLNRARVYYYAGDPAAAQAALQKITDELSVDPERSPYLITSKYVPQPNDNALRDRNWVFRHLGTAEMLRGWMAMDRFNKRVEYFQSRYPLEDETALRRDKIKRDRQANQALREVVEAYVLGMAYAELYSPRSRSLGVMHNDLYHRMMKFNRTELQSFQKHLTAVAKVYPKHLTSVGVLQSFLQEFFGLSEAAIGRAVVHNKPR
jgi:tetratricopeptide (TPR) repeat protein